MQMSEHIINIFKLIIHTECIFCLYVNKDIQIVISVNMYKCNVYSVRKLPITQYRNSINVEH